jgi:hypothetical protein
MAEDPFEGLDTSNLTDSDRSEIEQLKMIYATKGKDGLGEALSNVAKTNSTLFVWLLGTILD